MEDREMHCVICQSEMPFEAPPCQDEHSDDCPELVCTGCGAAIVIVPIAIRSWRPAGHRLVPIQRRAA